MVPNISHVLTDEDVSPVTLNDHWSRLARLILLASMSAVGSVGNVFMMSAVMIEDYLRKRGKLTPFFLPALRIVNISIKREWHGECIDSLRASRAL